MTVQELLAQDVYVNFFRNGIISLPNRDLGFLGYLAEDLAAECAENLLCHLNQHLYSKPYRITLARVFSSAFVERHHKHGLYLMLQAVKERATANNQPRLATYAIVSSSFYTNIYNDGFIPEPAPLIYRGPTGAESRPVIHEDNDDENNTDNTIFFTLRR